MDSNPLTSASRQHLKLNSKIDAKQVRSSCTSTQPVEPSQTHFVAFSWTAFRTRFLGLFIEQVALNETFRREDQELQQPLAASKDEVGALSLEQEILTDQGRQMAKLQKRFARLRWWLLNCARVTAECGVRRQQSRRRLGDVAVCNASTINKRKISESVRTASAESVKTNSKKSLLSHSESTRVRH
jgi:hypothetical protein